MKKLILSLILSLFAVGTTANPGTMTYEGMLSSNNEIPTISRGQ